MKKAEVDMFYLKSIFCMFLLATCLVFISACAVLTRQNPNVKTPLDAAKVTYDASCSWYVGVYNDVVLLNKDPYLSDKAVKILRDQVNPAMDKCKHTLIAYGTLIKQIESGGVVSSISEVALKLKAAELNAIKQSIIGLLLTISQIQIMEGG